MRLSAFALSCLIAAAACERNADVTAPEPAADMVVAEAPASDELPGLPAVATGIAFWDHPTLSFNSTMIVATPNAIVSYSMEDGNEIARIDGFNAAGVATSYLGFGSSAAGFIAFFDTDENEIKFYGIDNNSRAFLPLDSGPVIRGAVRGFCLGRGADAPAPSLFVVQKGVVQVFNLAASASGVSVESEAAINTPDNLVSCAVGVDGALYAASDNGKLYKVTGGDSFASPFASTLAGAGGVLGIVISASEDDPAVISSDLVVADTSTGVVQFFDGANGASLGAVRITATDDLPGVEKADVFGVTGGNLGGLYRNGVAAFGIADGADGPVIRLAPTSSLKNALQLPVGEPVSPRGEAPAEKSDTLIIPIELHTGEPE
ncbi:hypothetical protein [Hyphococcus sp.]|uniref:hypothetical protein n=1 Tax=Hyphococcus sp. TaxID=2038636 RepID=UPI002085EF5C|nr:MAG: hypothetical protein DHS20C04_17070 [Marinicaulis sp.]